MQKMEEFIAEELRQFEEVALIPNGAGPLTEEEFTTYGAIMASTWAALAQRLLTRMRKLGKAYPQAAPAMLELAKEILDTFPEGTDIDRAFNDVEEEMH